MAIVSTGQITLIDQNDGKPITVILTANQAIQQVFTKEDSTTIYNPNYSTVSSDAGTNLVITPKIYVGKVGGVDDLSNNTAIITNRKWSKTVGGTVLYNAGTTTQDTTSFVRKDSTTQINDPFTFSSNGVTLTINGNLKPSINSYPIYFEGDYVDPVTSLVTHFIANIELNIVATGTTATFIRFRGKTAIEESGLNVKNSVAVCADLIRGSSGIEDRTALKYRWYDITGGTAVEINDGFTGYATKFGFGDTAAASTPVTVALNTNIPTGTAGNSYNSSGVGVGNTITISETAVTDIGVFRVDIIDTADSNKTYSGTVCVYDITDPYDLRIISNTGDKLPNGVGSTTLTPNLWKGSTEITNFTGYVLTWVFYDRNGKQAGFVDVGEAANLNATRLYNGAGTSESGTVITANTGSSPFTITHSTPSSYTGLTLANNNMVKVVKDGVASYYQITASTATTLTLSESPTISGLTLSNYPLPASTNSLVGGVVFPCTLNGTRITQDSATAAGHAIIVRGQDIEAKGIVRCSANAP